LPGGIFGPNQNITRAEVATLIARFFDIEALDGSFTDIEGHWAEEYINRLAQFGWVQGAGDGRFRPDALITRAETAAMFNRMLGRLLENADGLLDGRTRWPDKTNMNAWYYLYMQEASHSTEYNRPEGTLYHYWTGFLPALDWAALQRPDSRPDDITVSQDR